MKHLLIISLIISITGILIILLLANNLKPEKINIRDLNLKEINQKIKTRGTITSLKTYSNFQIININQENYSVPILINQKTNLTKNQTIEVIGRIIEYKGSLEIEAEKITLTNLKIS